MAKKEKAKFFNVPLAYTTKKPTGLSIARNGTTFTAAWKCGDKNYNGGQKFQIATNWGNWWSDSVSTSARSKAFFTFDPSWYFPVSQGTKFNSISFRVMGKAKDDAKNYVWSEWVSCDYQMYPPNAPSLSAELNSTNQTTFSWTTEVSDTDNKPFYKVWYESILIRECTETAWWNLWWGSGQSGWTTGSTGASGSAVITESGSTLATGSYTRWIRCRAEGAAGASNWVVSKHVYATPWAANITSASSSISNNVTTVDVRWVASQNAAHPIDSTKVQYGIDTPASGLTVPVGISPTDIASSIDTGGTDGFRGQIDDIADLDECMWVRVVTTHDSNNAYSDWKLVQKGKLKTPDDLTASFADRVTVTAENNSDVPDSVLAVVYKSDVTPAFVVGIIPHGSTSVTVPFPADGSSEKVIGVYAFQGTYTQTTRADGVYSYSVNANMKSDEVWLANSLPTAPSTVLVESSETVGEVIVTWDWAWQSADVAELSWSQNPNSWDSTDEPDTYELDNSHAARWRISDLDTGATWYFKVRLGIKDGDDITYGPYSEIVSKDLSSAPAIPDITADKGVITENEGVTVRWAYITTDGTPQAYAELCEATISGTTVTYGSIIARTETAQYADLDTSGWNTGETHSLCVRVASYSGRWSEWSTPVSITVAEPVTCAITSTSLETITLTDDDENTRTVTALTEMPLTATITGANVTGTTRLTIERAEDYYIDRPDETRQNCYTGELIAVYEQTGESQITLETLIGHLDDGAAYNLIATVTDTLGQSASASIPFEVHWTHQAVMPVATVVPDTYNLIAKITPIAPTGWASGDTCDIYRLSVDKPVLIVKDAVFGTTYVDPYPAFGETGGHRIAYKTADGDYITADGTLAWLDLRYDRNDYLPIESAVVDFGGDRVQFDYNITASHTWKKDFTETAYLGGSVQGDWTAAVSRTTKVDAILLDTDLEQIEAMRRLATYTGICNVRTPDGSSFSADVQVSEDREYSNGGKICRFSLSITRIDPEEPDGMLLTDWEG